MDRVMQREDGVLIGTGNVFADLGLDDPEELLFKAKLVQRISQIIDDNGWTNAEAALVLGIDETAIATLVRGRLGDFSVDQLLRFVSALGYDVTIGISPNTTARRHAHAEVNESVAASGTDSRSPVAVRVT